MHFSWSHLLLVIGFGLSGAAQGQVAGNSCSALGVALPEATSAWQALHFPQASLFKAPKTAFGLAYEGHPDLPFSRLRQLAIFWQPGRFHVALYSDFFGNSLFGWQQYQCQAGIGLGKWRLGGGIWSRRTQIEHFAQWSINGQLGASGPLHRNWWWHVAFGQLRQTGPDALLLNGTPPASARLLIEHQPAQGTRLWLLYQQQNGWPADVGLGLQWQIHPRLQVDWGISPPYRRLSVGLLVVHRHLQVRLQARFQELPGLWWGNQWQWTGPPS